jgi:anaphase-promoting complex subunit 2
MANRHVQSDSTELHAKILSRFFWPEIQEQEFKVPHEIAKLQESYATGFEALKASRKLKWRNGLGQVTVELELENHHFVGEVTTWQATVIYAFNSDTNTDTDPNEPATKTITELSDTLSMTPALVRSACLFWVSKRILTEPHRDTFRVLEILPSEDEAQTSAGGGITGPDGAEDEDADGANAAAAAEAAAAAAAKESAEAAAMEKMNLHWQFIVGMLTNQGPMPLQNIVMMLKIVVPGGFPFSNEELREFLGGMVSRGKLEVVSGGSYKIVH